MKINNDLAMVASQIPVEVVHDNRCPEGTYRAYRGKGGLPLINQGGLMRTQQSSSNIGCLFILGCTCD